MTSYPQFSGAQPLRPSVMGSAGPHQNFGPPMPIQFRSMGPAQQTYHFTPSASQFQSIGQGVTAPSIGVPSGQLQMPHFSQPTMHPLPGSGQSSQVPPPLQAMPMPFVQPNRPISSGSVQPQQNTQLLNNHVATLGSAGLPHSMSFTYATSYGQQPNSMNAPSQYQAISQIQAPVISGVGQLRSSSGINAPPVRPLVQSAEKSSVVAATVPITSREPNPIRPISSDWQEHTSPDGRRYYHNKKTKQSTWEKPLELMTPLERADASTEWKEFTTTEGRKYYYNKATKQSKWTIPDELKIAREQAEKMGTLSNQTEGNTIFVSVADTVPSVELPHSPTSSYNFNNTAVPLVVPVQIPLTPAVSAVDAPNVMDSESLPTAVVPSAGVPSSCSLETDNAVSTLTVKTPGIPPPASFPASLGTDADSVDALVTTAKNNHNITPLMSGIPVADEASTQDLEEAKRCMPANAQVNIIPLEAKPVLEEPLVYSNKLEAKNAFKALLESSNIGPDWTWEQAMRVIINDKRYSALKTLGEKKQAFNEYSSQRKKQEVEERRIKQKKAREEFTRMLEECKELTSSTRWSKAVAIFEKDERFNAVERARDREDIFETYLTELEKKERAKAAEEHKRNIIEYRAFLESCDFIKANSQWRKVQGRLEGDERCSRLAKFDRLEIFQDYIRDLEKEEEEQRKIQKEQVRKAERKNRDDFRKLMEGHVADGILTAKTHWRDYIMKVKDLPSFIAVSSNTSGATPKDLFEDVAEELDKQYHEDKSQIKDALKIGKIALELTMTFEDFKTAITEDESLRLISDVNLKFVYNELIERLREREEKEAKRRQHLANNFYNQLCSIKEITASSTWEECKYLVEDCPEYTSIGEESFERRIFENYVGQLQERANEERRRDEEKAKKEKEREEKEKRRKERKEKESQREKEKGEGRFGKGEAEHENVDVIDNYGSKVSKKRDKDRERKHRKHNHNKADDVSSEKEERKVSKRSHGHSSEHKKSRKHTHSSESESETRQKRHKKDRDASRRTGAYHDIEDGEFGEDGEIH